MVTVCLGEKSYKSIVENISKELNLAIFGREEQTMLRLVLLPAGVVVLVWVGGVPRINPGSLGSSHFLLVRLVPVGPWEGVFVEEGVRECPLAVLRGMRGVLVGVL